MIHAPLLALAPLDGIELVRSAVEQDPTNLMLLAMAGVVAVAAFALALFLRQRRIVH
jgi:hypothetical protein